MGEKQPKTTLTLDQLRSFAADLHLQATAIENFAKQAEERGMSTLSMKNYASGLQGIDKLTSFTSSVYKALSQRTLEKDLGEETPRSSQEHVAAQVEQPTEPGQKPRLKKSGPKSKATRGPASE